MERHRRFRMARIALPLACISFFQSHGGTLVIIPLESSLCDIFKSLVGNLQVRTQHLTALLDGISSGNRQRRKIDKLNILGARSPIRRSLRSHLKHRLASGIDNLDIARAIDKRKFLRVCRTIANLVNIGRSSRRHRSKRKHRSGEWYILF